ncbi:MAG: UDP-N-acetylglucosamine 1-carboxyvinyltransferase [Bacillota bacterium]|jgi:UDP-N-acetylglucosamine 1-carboxyvinyltransferase|nr:UDP-N-acetylglucosamine 1-carboxyvinyltransferase [Bacillota bacterium]HHU43168.1 UDP-N-acetylglucosamine 1-carboxyvinyltransferase [Clostridiales bacterium]
MAKLVINGGNRLYGCVEVQGAKNAILPLMAAAMLTDEKVVIKNVPNLIDVHNMSKILLALGADIDISSDRALISAANLKSSEIAHILAKELRSSIFLLGPVLGRLKQAKVAYPGGCDIGLRPIDIHLKALREMNVKIVERSGYIYCDASKMTPTELMLDYPSVGATENIILASATLKGKTTIMNAAREPEIVDLQNFLNTMGGNVKGAGTPFIEIEGVERLHGSEYRAMGDRIVAGTYAIAAAMCGGEIVLKGCKAEHIQSLLSKLSKTSCNIKHIGDNIEIAAKTKREAIEYIETQPYPGFPTDLQAPIIALQTISHGVSVITENIFENRYKHVCELLKMGANIRVKGRTAIVRGVERLSGAEVISQDLRGGAALVLAGLNAIGTTIISNVHHIDRGYEDIEKVLKRLGADIRRV